MFNKYLVFIDSKNAYDKFIHNKLFEKLNKYGINSKLIGTIKLLYSYEKLKMSNNLDIINANNGILQGSLISSLSFYLYINVLITELNKNVYEVLAYADDLAIIVDKKSKDYFSTNFILNKRYFSI